MTLELQTLDTPALQHLVAEAAGLLAHREGGGRCARMLHKVASATLKAERFRGPDDVRVIIDEACARLGVTYGQFRAQGGPHAWVAVRNETARRIYDLPDPDRPGRRRYPLKAVGWFVGRSYQAAFRFGETARVRR